MSPEALHRQLNDPDGREALAPVGNGTPYVVVDLSGGGRALALDQPPPCPVIGWSKQPVPQPPLLVDVVIGDHKQLDRITRQISAQPLAAATLVGVLRHNQNTGVHDGLLTESLAYSTLQHSKGFNRWLAQRPELEKEPARHPAQEQAKAKASASELSEPVRVERHKNALTITLNRPERHNAYSAAMRDALCNGLHLALVDPSIQTLSLRGAGASFCSGGDLHEFGLGRDAGEAHVTRVARSAGALLHALATKTDCLLHGACIGAGIELPAFAGVVAAAEDSVFQLPELSFGLIPGAGGTVSLPRRIGRRRTALLALSGEAIDAATALRWGLIDQLR